MKDEPYWRARSDGVISDELNTCATCTHWAQDDIRIRNFVKIEDVTYGICRLFTDADEKYPMAEAVCLSEGIGGEFLTQSSFGCIAYEESKTGNAS